MTKNDFRALQSKHLKLLRRQEDASLEEMVEYAKSYIERVLLASGDITSNLERDQLRANLRYWATIVAEGTGEYPKIDLIPVQEIEYVERGR